jgi:hypothetical protein
VWLSALHDGADGAVADGVDVDAGLHKEPNMDLGRAIPAVGVGERAESFQLFSKHIDRDWIARALQATGTATVRRRKLPAEYVVWIVVGMGLLRDRSIREVVRHLDLVLPDAKTPQDRGTATGSAVVQARNRLGAEPLAALFEQTASAGPVTPPMRCDGTGWLSTGSTAPRYGWPTPR